MQVLLDKLTHGPESDFPSLIYGYKQSSADAQKMLVATLKVLRAPAPGQHMTVDKFHQAGRFTMMVARVPWQRSPEESQYQPIIFCREGDQEQVVGYILAFNDVGSLIPEQDRKSLNELTDWFLEQYGNRISAKR
jgi:hypothetical protein